MNYLTTEMKVKLNAKICIDLSLSSNTEPTYRLSQFLPCSMCNHISYFKICAGWKVPIISSTKRIFEKANWRFLVGHKLWIRGEYQYDESSLMTFQSELIFLSLVQIVLIKMLFQLTYQVIMIHLTIITCLLSIQITKSFVCDSNVFISQLESNESTS